MTSKRPMNRREFLRLSALGLGSLAGGHLLSACSPMTNSTAAAASPTVIAATAQAATATAPLTSLAPATLATNPKPDIIKFFPSIASKVIRTHHTGVWSDKNLVPGALRQMLDASITKLTGLNDAREAWSALFKPGDRIAIKVNAFSNSLIWTHVPLVQEVTNSLQEVGIPAENITIFDYKSYELTAAGFTINTENPGVRCTGMDSNYASDPTLVENSPIKLANILKDCTALINIPILKSHMLSGISFAMKNHYGSVWYPDMLHGTGMKAIAALNALPEIKDRTRLIVGDAVAANLRYANSYPYWQEDWTGDSIFMSFDPVAHDSMGMQLLTSELEKDGGNPAYLVGMANPSMKYAVELGLGTNDPAHIESIEQTVG